MGPTPPDGGALGTADSLGRRGRRALVAGHGHRVTGGRGGRGVGVAEGARRGGRVGDLALDDPRLGVGLRLAGADGHVVRDRAQDVIDEVAGPGEGGAVVGDLVGVGHRRAVAHVAAGRDLGHRDAAVLARDGRVDALADRGGIGVVEGAGRGRGVLDGARDGTVRLERQGLVGAEHDGVGAHGTQDAVDEGAGPRELVAVVGDRVGVGHRRAVAHGARRGQLGERDAALVAGHGHRVTGGRGGRGVGVAEGARRGGRVGDLAAR